MAIIQGTPITELDSVIRIEVGKRLEVEFWQQEDSPNDDVYSLVITEGKPNAIWEKEIGAASDPIEYVEMASIDLCEYIVGSWFYDSASLTLYLHTSTDADPGGAGFLFMMLFWKPFSNVIMDVDGIPSEPLIDKGAIPGITSEISIMSAGGSRTAFGSITLKNDNYFFYTDLSLYEYQAKRLECWAGNAGTLFSAFDRYFVGWTGDIEETDSEMSINIEDLRVCVP